MKIELVFTESDAHKILQEYKKIGDLCLTDACPTKELTICNICEICPLRYLNKKDGIKYVLSHIHKEQMMWSVNVDDYIEHIDELEVSTDAED